ncbi:MAG TPA: bifunctional diaminohydroxyphosphoribosylaminopyrimidine deaminase/5-amino-6-(5-phosphoribosylamino)uracil reductase RibD [Gemmatimonadaceae bacterium]|nr:bifunctional diaminohydroxyphosphoribosylaminopyrimidine deaminase/5-amino-6-(5-phosphoribosylamino)uracil reductase RibD [Gemmatimonadaceae bacterium]
MTDSSTAHDAQFMRRALDLAREGWGQTAPNPMVGAVVVRDGKIVGEGYHARFGEAHAEIMALRAAGSRAEGATLYVTLEPCRHYGKTPPCTEAILESGVERVVIAVADPTDVAGGGAAILRNALLDVDVGVLEAEARELNAPFFNAVRSDLPWTTLKLAVSIETAIARRRGSSDWLTGPESRAEVHRMRAGSDAIAVGVGTVIADDPELTVREFRTPRKAPARVVFDRRLRTPPGAKVIRTARQTPTIVVTESVSSKKAESLRAAGVHLIAATDLREGFRRLRSAGARALLLEGGATIAAAVLEAKLVNRLVIFQAPVALGSDALHAFDGARPGALSELESYPVVDRRQLGGGAGPDVMTTYALSEI